MRGKLDQEIQTALQSSCTHRPRRPQHLEERYVNLTSIMSQKRMRLGELQQQLTMSQMMPKYDFDPESGGRAQRIAELTRLKRVYTRGLETMRRQIRNFNSDSTVKRVAERSGRRAR